MIKKLLICVLIFVWCITIGLSFSLYNTRYKYDCNLRHSPLAIIVVVFGPLNAIIFISIESYLFFNKRLVKYEKFEAIREEISEFGNGRIVTDDEVSNFIIRNNINLKGEFKND